MATKGDILVLFSDKKNYSFGHDSQHQQYSNLNLNQISKNSIGSFVHSNSNSVIDKQFVAFKVSGTKTFCNNETEKQILNKSFKLDLGISNSVISSNHGRPPKKQWKNDDYFKDKTDSSKNSTLSLHIAAYENSIENGGVDSVDKKEDKISLPLNTTFGNPFEFPRQREDNTLYNPEIMRFKTSQKLFAPMMPHGGAQAPSQSYKVVNSNFDSKFVVGLSQSQLSVFIRDFMHEMVIVRGRDLRETLCAVQKNKRCTDEEVSIGKLVRENLGINLHDNVIIRKSPLIPYGNSVKILVIKDNAKDSMHPQDFENIIGRWFSTRRFISIHNTYRIKGKVENVIRGVSFKVVDCHPRPFCEIFTDSEFFYVHTEQVRIAQSFIELLKGKNGRTLTKLTIDSGCKLTFKANEGSQASHQNIILQGSQVEIERVKTLIKKLIQESILQQTVTSNQEHIQKLLSIPGTKCGLIIGRNGETIKSLQETLGVKMLLIQENQAISHGPKPLRITGTPDKVENACRTIESIINSEEEGGGRPQHAKSVGEVIVPRSSVGIIIGKSGETIKRLINESGCKIQFKPDEDPNTPDRCATLQGTPDQIARATQMISDLLQRSQNSGITETFLMHVPANKTGLVIGKGGDTIKQICGESGAHVELSRDPPPNASEKIFVIKGSPYQIHHAQHIIRIKVGDIPPGTPVPHFTGSTSAAAATTLPTANPYGSSGFDGGYNQWQQYGAYTTGQTDANQWSNYYQQQQQPQAAAYGGYGTGATANSVTSAQTQQQSSGAAAAPVQDYSAQWEEHYRQMGMHEKAALVEEQAKKQQSSSATSQQATSGYSTGSYN